MKKEVIGYKVVAGSEEFGLRSARIWWDSVWCITYPVGVRTKGYAGTPVLAFRDLKSAQGFVGSNPLRQHTYRARLENPRQVNAMASLILRHLWRRFWRQGNPTDWANTFVPPPGTVACDAITLLKEVH